MRWIFDMLIPCKKEIHRLNLELDKTRDERESSIAEILQSAKRNRLSLAQSGINGIDDFLKGIKK